MLFFTVQRCSCVRSVAKHHSNVAGLFLALFLSNASIQKLGTVRYGNPTDPVFAWPVLLLAAWGSGFWGTTSLAGILMIHKMDLIQLGCFFCCAHNGNQESSSWLRSQSPALHCLFGIFLPGAILTLRCPNFFVTTLSTTSWSHLPRRVDGFRLTCCSTIALSLACAFHHVILSVVFKKAANHRTLYFSLGVVVVHTFAYSCFPPIEPYNWYAMPSLFALVWMSTFALGNGLALLPSAPIRWGVAAASTEALLMFVLPIEHIHKERWLSYRAVVERDRAEAGRWVAAHTANDAQLLTGWGNPALYAQRKTVDSSYFAGSIPASGFASAHEPRCHHSSCGHPGHHRTTLNPRY